MVFPVPDPLYPTYLLLIIPVRRFLIYRLVAGISWLCRTSRYQDADRQPGSCQADSPDMPPVHLNNGFGNGQTEARTIIFMLARSITPVSYTHLTLPTKRI